MISPGTVDRRAQSRRQPDRSKNIFSSPALRKPTLSRSTRRTHLSPGGLGMKNNFFFSPSPTAAPCAAVVGSQSGTVPGQRNLIFLRVARYPGGRPASPAERGPSAGWVENFISPPAPRTLTFGPGTSRTRLSRRLCRDLKFFFISTDTDRGPGGEVVGSPLSLGVPGVGGEISVYP